MSCLYSVTSLKLAPRSLAPSSPSPPVAEPTAPSPVVKNITWSPQAPEGPEIRLDRRRGGKGDSGGRQRPGLVPWSWGLWQDQ